MDSSWRWHPTANNLVREVVPDRYRPSAAPCPAALPRIASSNTAAQAHPRGRSSGLTCIGPILALCATLATPAHAQLRPERLEQLLADGEAERAHELALEHREALEGELLFDFYYGLAAIESGHVSEGVFALERVIMRRPGFGRARLALGRGYFLLGDDRRAEEHFAAALAQDPPANVRNTVERYRQRIRRRANRYSTVVTGHVEAGLGTDSNVNGATDNETVDSILGPLSLNAGSREKDDEFARVSAGVDVSRPLAEDVTGFVRLDFNERANFDEDDFDRRRLDVRLGSTFAFDRWRTMIGARLQRFYVGGDTYQDLFGIDATANYRLSQSTALHTGLQVSELDNDVSDNLDSTLWLISGGITRAWRARLNPVGSLSLFVGGEDADESTNAAEANTQRDMLGLSARLRLQLTSEWDLDSRFQYRQSEYDEAAVLLGEKRDEDYYQLAADLGWSPNPHWRIGPILQVSENDASTELHEYDRTTFEVRARYNFY